MQKPLNDEKSKGIARDEFQKVGNKHDAVHKLSLMTFQYQAEQYRNRVIKQCDVENNMKEHGASPPLWSHKYL